MPTKKPPQSKKTPPSQMLRVPTPLIEAVKELSRLHRLGHKNAVLHGLQSLLSEIDSSTDIDTGASGEVVRQLQLRVEKLESHFDSDIDSKSILKSVTSLEEKLEAVTTRLAQLEGAIAVLQRNSGTKRSSRSYPNQYYQREAPQLQPFEEKNLALRLVSDPATLRDKRESLSPEEFIRWCKDRDPSGMGWRYEEKDRLYHPVK